MTAIVYLAACWLRWLVGRHYGESFRLLVPSELLESVELCRSELPVFWARSLGWLAAISVAGAIGLDAWLLAGLF